MSFSIAVVDDNADDLKRMKDILSSLDKSSDIDTFSDAESLLNELMPGRFHILFLDIQMEGMDGIELAKKVRETDPHVLIIFQTTSKEYAFDAFPVHPFDYVVKPCKKERIGKVLSEAKKVFAQTVPEISIKVAYGELRLPIDRIISVVSDRHNVMIDLDDDEEPIRCIDTFTGISEKLEIHPCFLFCNRGVYINMDHAVYLEDDGVRMKNDVVFPFRTRDKQALKMQFSQYRIDHMKQGMWA